MKKILIYDLPIRLFHWSFAAFFLCAILISKLGDDDSPIYAYHMLAGIMLVFLVCLRFLWGLVGSKNARFTAFPLNPLSLFEYLKGVFQGGAKRWAAYQPASAWAALTMMFLALGLGVTGYFMTTGQGKSYKEIHELFANAFIVVVLFHLAGLVLHTLRHRDWIALSMLNGKKSEVSEESAIPSARPIVGIVSLVLLLSFGMNLYKNYDSNTRKLNFFGITLNLGENENEGAEGAEGKEGADGDEDDD